MWFGLNEPTTPTSILLPYSWGNYKSINEEIMASTRAQEDYRALKTFPHFKQQGLSLTKWGLGLSSSFLSSFSVSLCIHSSPFFFTFFPKMSGNGVKKDMGVHKPRRSKWEWVSRTHGHWDHPHTTSIYIFRNVPSPMILIFTTCKKL